MGWGRTPLSQVVGRLANHHLISKCAVEISTSSALLWKKSWGHFLTFKHPWTSGKNSFAMQLKKIIFTTGIIQLTKEFEFPAKTVFVNNLMIIDLRLRF